MSKTTEAQEEKLLEYIDPDTDTHVLDNGEVSWGHSLELCTVRCAGVPVNTDGRLTPARKIVAIDRYGIKYKLMICLTCLVSHEDVMDNPQHNPRTTCHREDEVFYVTPHADDCTAT